MSDPVIKGAKRLAARPAPHTISPGATAKNRKPAAKTAALAKRTAAEKSPVRKATPAKNQSAASKTAPRATKTAKTASPARKAETKPRTSAAATAPAKSSKTAANTKVTARLATKQAKRNEPARGASAANKVTNKGATPSRARPVSGQTKPSRPATPKTTPRQPPTGDEAAALRAFERAHKEFVRGRFADARNLFRALIEEHAGVPEVTARARTYLTIAEARLRTENSLPRSAEELYDRGVIELNRGEYVAAQELFERALKRDEMSADIHYALAATRARLGSIQLALQSLERALDLRPNLRIRAQHDPDLIALRADPDYERLVFPARA